MPTSALSSHGTLMKIGDGGGSEVFTTIAEVRDISGPSFAVSTEDVTNHDSSRWREHIATIKEGGEITFDINYYSATTQDQLRTDMLNSARFLKAHALSNGKLGVTGFCWGGGTTNYLAATMGEDMHAGVPFYGAAADTASVARIKAPLLIQYAETDERINAMWPAFEAALKEAAAKLAWERTVAHFRKHLGAV